MSDFAVVTGATSGIGRELADVLERNGFEVFRPASADFDLATPEGVEALYAALPRPVDLMAFNAGVSEGGEFATGDLAAHLRLIDLDVRGTVHLAKLITADMRARGRGRVLFTSSMVATMPGPFQATYNASKSFIQSFALALRNELRPHGVSVTVLMPGPTDTPIFARAGQLDTLLGGTMRKADPADVAQAAFEGVMAGRERVVAASLPLRVVAHASGLVPDAVKGQLNRLIARPLRR